ncbi:DUF5677 domain-containing protein [Chromobacterium sp.]|uniref:DUF5677 domain-containing protein n=1 Tax=Chromobacterium sp. TaxID=306190 RepID=UPI0035B11CBD
MNLDFIEKFSCDHSAHLEHIAALSKAVNILSSISEGLDVNDMSRYVIPKVQVDYLLISSVEAINSLRICAEAKHFSSVEALSRISIEMSVNLRLLISGDLRETSKAFARSYLKSKKRSAEKWLKLAEGVDDQESKHNANTVLAYLERWRNLIPWMKEDGKVKWPETVRDKFKAVEEEGMYLTVFASASDSVHSLSEDVFNRTCMAIIHRDIPREYLAANNAEKASFAVYLYACAVTFYYNTIALLVDRYDLNVDVGEVDGCSAILSEINKSHNAVFEEYELILKGRADREHN